MSVTSAISSRPEIRSFLFCFQSLEPIVCSLYVRWMDGWMDGEKRAATELATKDMNLNLRLIKKVNNNSHWCQHHKLIDHSWGVSWPFPRASAGGLAAPWALWSAVPTLLSEVTLRGTTETPLSLQLWNLMSPVALPPVWDFIDILSLFIVMAVCTASLQALRVFQAWSSWRWMSLYRGSVLFTQWELAVPSAQLKFSARILKPLTERPGPSGDWLQGLPVSPQSRPGFGHSLMGGSEDGDICLMSSRAANLRCPECSPVWGLGGGKPCRVGRASGICWKEKQILPPTKYVALGRAFHLSEPISSSVKWERCELRSRGARGDMQKGKLSSFIAAFGFPMAPLSSEMCLLSSKERIPPGPAAHLPAAWLTALHSPRSLLLQQASWTIGGRVDAERGRWERISD